MEFLIALCFLAAIVLASAFLIAFFFSEEVRATKDKDPAARSYLEIILLYPGLHALVAYRIAHELWLRRLKFLARFVSQSARALTGIEIHPGAVIGKGFFIDHGMGVVIGETAVIGDQVTLFQGVTLGGTGKETGKRHPTIGDNVVVGTGAKILGNIEIGSNSYVGANAVVLESMPENSTVVGVPARVTKQDGKRIDIMMDHARVLDPVKQQIEELQRRLNELEQKAKP
ncbi:MAG: serine O-acetyltransferase [Candidatus Omnitrophica bacterium]|nr:serine O-acetyltransferase [Candidatus Omnitrophota bacterium]